jgi:hypothetical protein
MKSILPLFPLGIRLLFQALGNGGEPLQSGFEIFGDLGVDGALLIRSKLICSKPIDKIFAAG